VDPKSTGGDFGTLREKAIELGFAAADDENRGGSWVLDADAVPFNNVTNRVPASTK
jgi:hypothetical protein